MFTLDTKGLLCPEPILKTAVQMNAISDGEVLEVTSDDPGIAKDLPSWCKCNGHKVVKFSEKDGILTFRIRRGG